MTGNPSDFDDIPGFDDTVMDPPSSMADPPTTVDEAPPVARSDREIDRLVRDNIGILDAIAGKLARQIGVRLDRDEMLSVGREALFEAARDHDPERSPFVPYASMRARWAMLTHARRDSRHSSATLRKIAAISALVRVEESPLVTEPVAPTEDAYAERLRQILRAQSAALFVGLTSAPREADPAVDPEQALIHARASLALRQALEALPAREREIVDRHYFGGERFDAIAASLGVSKSWLSRIHARALETIGEALRDH